MLNINSQYKNQNWSMNGPVRWVVNISSSLHFSPSLSAAPNLKLADFNQLNQLLLKK